MQEQKHWVTFIRWRRQKLVITPKKGKIIEKENNEEIKLKAKRSHPLKSGRYGDNLLYRVAQSLNVIVPVQDLNRHIKLTLKNTLSAAV